MGTLIRLGEMMTGQTMAVVALEAAPAEGSLRLRVVSTETEYELSYEDPQCAFLVDFLGAVLRTFSTITNESPHGFDIEIVDGNGTLIVSQDPYAFETEVTLLTKRPRCGEGCTLECRCVTER